MSVWIVRRIQKEANEGCGGVWRRFIEVFEIFDMRYQTCACIAVTLLVKTAN